VNFDPAQLLLLGNILLKALGTRALCMVSLTMTFALFVWSMRVGSWLAFITAATFGFGTLWPALIVTYMHSRSAHDDHHD